MAGTQIRPQQGPQEKFLATQADIAIYGGAAGGGKSYGLLLEPLRHIGNPKFGAVIFRRQMTDVLKEGGLWDITGEPYGSLGAKSNQQQHNYTFASGARIGFGHLEHEKTKYDWQGAQIRFPFLDSFLHVGASLRAE